MMIAMKRMLVTMILCAAAQCLLACGGRTANKENPPKAAAPAKMEGRPKIKFDQEVYDFGTTSQVASINGAFVIHNVGDADLKLGKPRPGCGCTIAAVKPGTLQPGGQGQLSFAVSIDPNARGEQKKSITVSSNDPARTNI